MMYYLACWLRASTKYQTFNDLMSAPTNLNSHQTSPLSLSLVRWLGWARFWLLKCTNQTTTLPYTTAGQLVGTYLLDVWNPGTRPDAHSHHTGQTDRTGQPASQPDSHPSDSSPSHSFSCAAISSSTLLLSSSQPHLSITLNLTSPLSAIP